jgi:hypothetical protein
MALDFLPLLEEQRALLDTGRGFERFQQYLDTMLDADGEVRLPLAAFNPMSKPHVAMLLDDLIATDAEGTVRAALAEAAARLGGLVPTVRVGLVVVDDALGGWTNRYLTDMDHRFGAAGELKRGFATAYVWTGEPSRPDLIRAEVLSVVYRHCYKLRHGFPTTLRQMLTLEGLVSRFVGGADAHGLKDLRQVRAALAPHLDTTVTPILFAALYGDDAAISVGYPPLGVPPWGGFAVVHHVAQRAAWDPLAALGPAAVLPSLTLP